jgi:uncharacterized protein
VIGASPGPTDPRQRLVVLDALRGLALGGILIVNATLYFWPSYGAVIGLPTPADAADAVAAWIVRFGFEGKFFTLFALLFGIGMGMQRDRGWSTRRTVRRLLWLAALGAAHVTLLWWGDILLSYAVVGLILMLARDRSPRRLLAVAGALLLVPIVLTTALGLLVGLGAVAPAGADDGAAVFEANRADLHEDVARAVTVYRGSDVGAMITTRWGEYAFAAGGSVLSGVVLMVPAMFLVGAAAWRAGLVDGPDRRRHWRRIVRVSVPLALAANAAYAHTGSLADPVAFDALVVLNALAFVVGGASGAIAVASGGALLLRPDGAITRVLANAGRLALTNYLSQSLVMTTLALGYGAGLYGQLGHARAIAIGVVLYVAQLAASRWYLRRYRFGPVEWLWRTLSYGRAPGTG